MSNERDIVDGLSEMHKDVWANTIHEQEREITRLRTELQHRDRSIAELRKDWESLRSELEAEREAVRILAHGYVQCRGALILDHMLDANGKMFGTTNCALEYGSVVNANPIALAAIERSKA